MHMAFTSCNSTNNNHFLHQKKSFSARTVILTPSRLSVIASSAVWVKGLRGEEVGGGGTEEGSQKEAASLSKTSVLSFG